MAKRIVCTNQEPAGQDHDTAHIVEAGVGTSNGIPTKILDVDKIREDILLNNEAYYTNYGGNKADVDRYTCSCGYETIRSDPDSFTGNNLDKLPDC